MFALIVDDHPLLRQAIRQVIEDHFSSPVVREASTGEEAVLIVHAEPVELVVLDVILPDYSGLTVLKRINLETAVEAHIQSQSMEPKGFSTAPQFTKMVNSSMASNG
jgi:DNA-binding NarL/FixJ family response regulator